MELVRLMGQGVGWGRVGGERTACAKARRQGATEEKPLNWSTDYDGER